MLERRNNLRAELTTLVGREAEVAEVKRLVESNRLVTLTGSGGVGKTRIALRVSADLARAATYSDGVWLVELAGLADATLVPQAIAWALKTYEAPGRSLLDTLLDFLTGRRLLLVIDNCEHLVDACARVVERMLEALPDLYVLATSREPLGVPGEITWRVPSLALPESTGPFTAEHLLECASVQLLMERARAAAQGFFLTSDNMAAVAAVCQRLDGIPLAIELAAARLTVLTAQQLAERLGDVVRLLTTGVRTAVPRQKTLSATVDWSYQLLSDTEQTLFRRCGVFVGGWTLDAAESVCVDGSIDNASVLDLTAQLVSKSLVLAEDRGGVERYRMLEPIRQFAVEQLERTADAVAVRDRHLAWLVVLAERGEMELWRAEQVDWLERLEAEHDNIRAALEWGRISGRVELMLRLAAALARFWDVRGFLSEGYGWLAAALEATPSLRTTARAQGLARAGYLAVLRNDLAAADTHLAKALALAEELQNEETIGAALMIMGMVARARGDFSQAAVKFEQSLDMSRRAGHRPGVYTSLYLLASALRLGGDAQRAIALHEESLALKREHGDAWGVAASLFSLGSIARGGDRGRGAMLYRESLELRWQLRDRIGICVCLEGLAGLSTDASRSARFLGAAERLREMIGHKGHGGHGVTDPAAREIDKVARRLHSALGEAPFLAAWRSGRDLPLEQVVEDALAPDDEDMPATQHVDLTPTADLSPPESTHSHTPTAAPTDEFRDLVEDALRHLNDSPALREHPLLGRTPSTVGSDLHAAEAAALLQGDLLQAIERLRPPTPRPSPGSSAGPGGWIHYLVLYESYVGGRPNQEIMRRYYLGEGTFYRARKRAIDALAYDLGQRTARAAAGSPPHGS